MHDGIHTAALESAASDLFAEAQALEAGRSAFAALEPTYHRHDYDHARDHVWQSACAWSSDEAIGSLSGMRPGLTKVMSGLNAVIWHAYLQGWCEAADASDVDPIVWGCSWDRAAREWI